MAQPIAPSVVQDAIVQIMQSAGRGLPVDTDMARTLAVRLAPTVQNMGLHGLTSTALSSQAAFHALLSQHLGSPSAATYDPAFRRQLLQAIERANIHGPDYLGGVFDGIRLALGLERASGGARDTREPPAHSGRSDYRGLAGNVTPASFTTSQDPDVMRLRDVWGMNGGTYGYLYNQGFRFEHIYPAAQDARALGFHNVNDRGVIRPLAVIRRHGDNPELTNRRLQDFQGALRTDREFQDAVAALRAAGNDEARRAAALARIREISERLSSQHGVTADIAAQSHPAVREAIQEMRNRIVANEEAYRHVLMERLGPDEGARRSITDYLASLPPAERREFERRVQERARQAPTVLGTGTGTARQEGQGLTGDGLVVPTAHPPPQAPPDAGRGTADREGQELVVSGLVVPGHSPPGPRAGPATGERRVAEVVRQPPRPAGPAGPTPTGTG